MKNLDFANFQTQHEFLAVVDSDGAAIDSMEVKHRKCFGPLAVSTWGLEDIEEKFLTRWNEINLYEQTRGFNRFKGLSKILEEFDVPGHAVLSDWVQRSDALSNDRLARESAAMLKKVLQWSQSVNNAIKELPVPLPFEGVREALNLMSRTADIAILSGANKTAIVREWEHSDILRYVSVILSQSDGSKVASLERLMQCGYDKKRVIFMGDSPDDAKAAFVNGCRFYEIKPTQEVASWKNLVDKAWGDFCRGGAG